MEAIVPRHLKRGYVVTVRRCGNGFIWALKSGNGRVVAESVGTYSTLLYALRAAKNLAEAHIRIELA